MKICIIRAFWLRPPFLSAPTFLRVILRVHTPRPVYGLGMETDGWVVDVNAQQEPEDRSVVFRTRRYGPLLVCRGRYIDDKGERFVFVHLLGTPLALNL